MFAVLAWSLLLCTPVWGARPDQTGPQREQYFRCQGEDYLDTITSGSPGKALLQVNTKTVKVTGAFMFTDAEIPIASETDSEIKFDYIIAGTVLGDFGVFNKVNGHLRVTVNHGEPQKVTHRTWGEYECKSLNGGL